MGRVSSKYSQPFLLHKELSISPKRVKLSCAPRVLFLGVCFQTFNTKVRCFEEESARSVLAVFFAGVTCHMPFLWVALFWVALCVIYCFHLGSARGAHVVFTVWSMSLSLLSRHMLFVLFSLPHTPTTPSTHAPSPPTPRFLHGLFHNILLELWWDFLHASPSPKKITVKPHESHL